MRRIRRAEMTKVVLSRSILALGALISLAAISLVRAFPVDAPPQHCIERHGIWCVLEGARTENRRHAKDGDVFAVLPTVQTAGRQALIFVVPAACRASVSDRLDVVSFRLDQPYEGKVRDELQMAISATCTVTAWLPRWNDDPSEWAYSGALPRLRRCTNSSCDGSPLSAALSHIQLEYQRRLIRP